MYRLTPLLVAAILSLMICSGTAYAQEDLTPPELLEVSFSPDQIDTSNITDDLSGMRHAALFFAKPGTTQHAQVEFRPDEGWSQIIAGDLRDSVQQATFTLPQYSAFGEWEMTEVIVEDNVGNRVSFVRPEDDEEAGRGNDSWKSIYNGFSFEVGQAQAPQFDTFMFLPALGVQ
jgi:hypothetical protein